jgi:curved DNA-binding protein CbpA
MVSDSSYYRMLSVAEDSSMDEIKSAFRKLSLIHHPDRNDNSPESNAEFILLLNAYSILIDPQKRREYDIYLKESTVFRNRKRTYSTKRGVLPRESDGFSGSYDALLNHFNFLLWDIEDFIRDKSEADWGRRSGEFTLRQYVLKIITFIDKWVLEPAGHPDYFMEARQMKRLDPRDYITMIGSSPGKHGHSPYADVTDYFYNVRKRMDRFLEKTATADLMERIPGRDIRLIDCVLEAQNLTVHYLSFLLQWESGQINEIPEFAHSCSSFSL